MRRSTLTCITAAVFALWAGVSLAQTDVQDYVQRLLDEGFSDIEISRSFLGRTRIEASKGDQARELVISREGDLLLDRLTDQGGQDPSADGETSSEG